MKYKDNFYFGAAAIVSITYVFAYGYDSATWSAVLWILIHKTVNAHKK